MIRYAEASDATGLADVHVSSWQSAYRGIFPDPFLDGLDRARRSQWFERQLEGGAEILVADDGEVVGFCWVGNSDDESWGEVHSIYVHPAHWGRGHGQALLLRGEADLVAMGHHRALLWVLEPNGRGRRFYERQGWVLGTAIKMEDIGGHQVRELRYERARLTAG
ncbi:MAG TPA: GNAT family N-acetyltransferase [Acidimicrobiia bacterium]